MAQRGSLKVVSNVLLSPTGGEMKGVWLDGKRGASTGARSASRSRSTSSRRPGRRRGSSDRAPGFVDNCAEGGPNFGFDLDAADARDGLRERALAARALLAEHEDDPRRVRPDRPGEPLPPGHRVLLLGAQHDLDARCRARGVSGSAKPPSIVSARSRMFFSP